MRNKYNQTIIITFLIALLLLVLNSNTVFAQMNSQKNINNDFNMPNNVLPVTVNGIKYFPARESIEAIGGRITWFPALKLLNIKLGGKEVSLVIDVHEAEINGAKVYLEHAPTIYESRVLITPEVLHLLTSTVDNREIITPQKNIPNNNDPDVTAIRSFSYDDKTRIVIDISKKSTYKVITLSEPDRIVVDIDAKLNTLNEKETEIKVDDLLINRIRSGQFTEDTVRIVADMKDKYEFQVFDLSSPERIVLDIFVPKTQISNLVQNGISTEIKIDDSKAKGSHVIVIDPGHGGNQPGAIGPSGLKEKEVVLDIALKTKKLLEENGFIVFLTREKDIDVPLEKRPLLAMQKEATVFISIHTNSAIQKGSSTAKGIETYLLSSRYIGASAKDVADRENRASQSNTYNDSILNQIIADLEESASIGFSEDLAKIIQRNVIQHTGLSNRGVKQAPFIVLKGVNMAAVLIEVGFISNPNEEKLLKTNEFKDKVALALTSSIKEYVKNIPDDV